MEHFLRGKRFKNDDEVKNAIEEFFGSKNADFYEDGIGKLPERWVKIIDKNGEYVVS
jgi:hypothetical protein